VILRPLLHSLFLSPHLRFNVPAGILTPAVFFVKAGLQTSVGNMYIAAIYFKQYPNRMPSVFITKPVIRDGVDIGTTPAISAISTRACGTPAVTISSSFWGA
jgi:hypothetical protein